MADPGDSGGLRDETPITNLHLSMLDKMGVSVDKLGDSNGGLQGLSEI